MACTVAACRGSTKPHAATGGAELGDGRENHQRSPGTRVRDTGPTVDVGDDGTGSKPRGASCLRLSCAGASGDNRRRDIS